MSSGEIDSSGENFLFARNRIKGLLGTLDSADTSANSTSSARLLNHTYSRIVKDPTCDLARMGKAGSALVKSVRDEMSKKEHMDKFWNLKGSVMGELTRGDRKGLESSENESVSSSDEEERSYEAKTSPLTRGKGPSSSGSGVSSRRPHESNTAGHDSASRESPSLPVDEHRDEIVSAVRENAVVILVGETGSGKSTRVCRFLYEAGLCEGVVVTEPRRIAAISLAKRVATEAARHRSDQVLIKPERGGPSGVQTLAAEPVGQLVGYSVRFDEQVSDSTRIRFATEGVVVRELLTDPTLSKYDCVILDEAHERSVNLDVLLARVKHLLTTTRPDLKVVVTSATLQVGQFSSFFGGAPVVSVMGRTFPVNIVYSRTVPADYVAAVVDKAVEVLFSLKVDEVDGQPQEQLEAQCDDILVFLTGQEEIEVACHLLRDRIQEYVSRKGDSLPERLRTMLVDVLPVYANLPPEQQMKIFGTDSSVAGQYTRKVIVATNIAETSLTLPNVGVVIDSGLTKVKWFNSISGIEVLSVVPVSRSVANQRSGRAGRTKPGTAYRMYTRDTFYYDLADDSVPEILRCNTQALVLTLTALGFGGSITLESGFLSPPSVDSVKSSESMLTVLSAIHTKPTSVEEGDDGTSSTSRSSEPELFSLLSESLTHEPTDRPNRDAGANPHKDSSGLVRSITALGSLMCALPLDPVLSRMVVIGSKLNVTREVCAIASMLSAGHSIYHRPRTHQAEADLAKDRFAVKEGDHLSLLYTFQCYVDQVSKCKTHLDGRDSRQGRSRNGLPARLESNEIQEWTRKHFLNSKALANASRICDQLSQLMRIPLSERYSSYEQAGSDESGSCSWGTNWDAVRLAVILSYPHHVARRTSIGGYMNIVTGSAAILPKSSALSRNEPELIVYHEIMKTSDKEFVFCSTEADSSTLVHWYPSLFHTGKDVEDFTDGRVYKSYMSASSEQEMDGGLSLASIDPSVSDSALLRPSDLTLPPSNRPNVVSKRSRFI